MNEPLEPMEVERVLGEIAGITPAPECTRLALERIGAALAAEPTQRRRWVLPASIAAALILVAGIGVSLLPSRASAQEALATTLKANEDYKGWVHLTSGKDGDSLHWNTQTHAIAGRYGGTSMYFKNPETGEGFDYHGTTGLIRIGNYLTMPNDANQDTPLNFPALIEKLRAVAGQDAVKITQSADGGRDRFDITIATPTTQRLADIFKEGAGSLGRPTSVWVDPKTKLISAALLDGQEITLTYGGPEIRSIYDAGAPKDAKIYDNRPTAEAMTLVRRVRARLDKPLPDGIMVMLYTATDPHISDDLTVYGRWGAQWARRSYPLASLGAADKKGGIQLPEHWQDSASDEFFRRLAETMPEREIGGDGTKAWDGLFDADTGEPYVSYATATMDENGKTTTTSEGKVAGRDECTGAAAQSLERICSPTRWFYPEGTNTAYSTLNHLDLITAPDRPGEVALRALFPDNTPDSLRFMTQEWIDPAHEDRAVTFQTLTFIDPKVRQIDCRVVKQFGEYATLPAPDGRSYPTVWTETTYDANGSVQDGPTVTELRFFPGRRMPEIPKKPDGKRNP